MEYKDFMFEVKTIVGKIVRKKNGFNLFMSMFNWYNEKYLHSSFISMMLSLDERYLKLFIEEIKRMMIKVIFVLRIFVNAMSSQIKMITQKN